MMRQLSVSMLSFSLMTAAASAALDVGNSLIFGSGWTGGPDSSGGDVWTEGTHLPLGSTTPSTHLHEIDVSWTDASSNPVSYTQTLSGGLAGAAGDSVTISGNFNHHHDAIDPGDDTIWFGTLGVILDLAFTGPVQVDIDLSVTNSLNDSTAEYYYGVDAYSPFAWDGEGGEYLLGDGVFNSTAPTGFLSFSETFPAGSYRFDVFSAIWTEPSWAGGDIDTTFTATVSPIPEPAAMAALAGALALALSLCRRR